MAIDHGQISDATAERRTIASFPTYREAEAAVDRLSDQGFEVERAAIVAQGLALVEEITGRTTALRAAASGAWNGALVGALVGWILGLFNWVDPLVSAIAVAFYGLIAGAVIGGAVALALHLSIRGRRDFDSVSAVRAERYDVMVDHAVADRARELL